MLLIDNRETFLSATEAQYYQITVFQLRKEVRKKRSSSMSVSIGIVGLVFLINK